MEVASPRPRNGSLGPVSVFRSVYATPLPAGSATPPPTECLSSVGGGLAEAATGPSVPPRVQQGLTRRREAAKRGLGAVASCWQCSAKARSSQQGASAPRPRFAPPRVGRASSMPPASARPAPTEGELNGWTIRWRWGRGPRGEGRRVQHSMNGGGTGGSRRGLGEATSNGHPKGPHLEGAAPSAPVPRRGNPTGRAS